MQPKRTAFIELFKRYLILSLTYNLAFGIDKNMLSVISYLYIKEVVTYHAHHIIFSRNDDIAVFYIQVSTEAVKRAENNKAVFGVVGVGKDVLQLRCGIFTRADVHQLLKAPPYLCSCVSARYSLKRSQSSFPNN